MARKGVDTPKNKPTNQPTWLNLDLRKSRSNRVFRENRTHYTSRLFNENNLSSITIQETIKNILTLNALGVLLLDI